MDRRFNRRSKLNDVISDPVFGDFGRLLLPVHRGSYSGTTLESLRLMWYGALDPDMTVDIVNTLKEQAAAGQQIFYRIYSGEECRQDARKRDTGLFFFRGRSTSGGRRLSADRSGDAGCEVRCL